MTLSILAMFWALSVAAEVVVPLLLAMMLKLTLQPAMRFLSHRMKLPMTISALLLIVALFSVAAGIGLTIAVPASGWIKKAPQGLKTLQDQLSLLSGPIAAAQYVLQQAAHLAETPGGPGGVPALPAQASTDLAASG
jgi:predicted PurR-regulated permease PerM